MLFQWWGIIWTTNTYSYFFKKITTFFTISVTSLYRCNAISSHCKLDCLFNSLFRLKTMETSKIQCNGFPSNRAIQKMFPWHHNVQRVIMYSVYHPGPGPLYQHILIKIRTWIRNNINYYMSDVISHPCHNFDNNLTKPSLKFWHGCIYLFMPCTKCWFR